MKPNGEWEDDDEFGTTYGTMKQAMREAAEAERDRIINYLEKLTCSLDGIHHSENLCDAPHHLKTVISKIKEEQPEPDACEPADLPCVNGFSCQKHQMTKEEAVAFLEKIKGEQK